MTVRSLSEVFLLGAEELPERLRTLSVTPTRFVEPGTTVEATFGFYNSGGATATGLRVRFAQPEGLLYIAGSAKIDGVPQNTSPDGAFVAPSGALLGEIGPGVERRVSVLYRVNEHIEDGTALALQAALAANETMIVGSNIVRLVARSRPLLLNPLTTVTLEAPAGSEPGRELLVRARITNQGQSSANDVVLVFPIPEHTRYTPRTARVDGRLLSDDRALPFEAIHSTIVAERLAPGQSVIADFIATIESPLDNGTLIQAGARLSSREVQEFEIRSNELLVASMPSFDGDGTTFSIAGSDEVVPGMRLRMELRATNIGTSAARRVIAQIALPTGLVYSPGSATLDGLPISDDRFESLSYAFDAIVPGRAAQLAFDAVVSAPAPADKKLPIGAKLRWESGERAFARTLIIRSEPRFTRAKNMVERGSPQVAQPGESVTFVVHVLNEGTAEATGVQLLLRGDATLTVVGAESNVGSLTMTDAGIDIGTVEPYVEHVITITTRISTPLPDKSEVSLGAELVTVESGAMDIGVASYSIRSRPRFAAGESALRQRTQDALRPNRPADIALHIANSGTDMARDVRVVLSAPPEVNIRALDGTRLVNGELLLDSIPPSSSRDVLMQAVLTSFIPNGTVITIEARIESSTLAPVPLHPVSIETRAEAEFSGELVLLSQPTDEVNAGEPLSYMLSFRNLGDGPAHSVVVRMKLPEQLVYMPSSTTVNTVRADDENGTSPLWSAHGLVLTDVDPGIPVQVRCNTVVTSPITSGTGLSAEATLEWDGRNLAVQSSKVIVRSTPEFASSPGGHAISIARLAQQMGGQVLPTFELPALPAIAPVATPPAAHIPEVHFAEPQFSAPAFSEPQAAEPIFSEPQFAAPVSPEPAAAEVQFSAPQFAEPQATFSEPTPVAHAAPVEAEEEMPFFSPPPALEAAEVNPSSFSFVEPPIAEAEFSEAPHAAMPEPVADFFTAPPSAQPVQEAEIQFSAPPEHEHVHHVEEIASTPQAVIAEPEPVIVDPEPVVTKPEAVVAEPEPIIEAPAPVPTPAPAPAAVKPEPVTRPFILEPIADEHDTEDEESEPVAEAPVVLASAPAATEVHEEIEYIQHAEPVEHSHEPEHMQAHEEPMIAAPIAASPVSNAVLVGPTSVLAFAPDRLRRTLSFLQQSDYGKLVSHLFALEAFFPDRIEGEAELDELFVSVRDAFRSTLDRLFVRLRLPRYAIAARDLEDRSSREAVITLVQKVGALSLREAATAVEPVSIGIRVRGTIDRDSLRHALEAITDAPLGGVTPWIACVSLLGTTVETATESADVLGVYRDTLLSVLHVLESLPMSEFHRVLTNSSNAELDKALNDVVRVLGGPVEVSSR